MKIVECKQGTPEWLAARLGRATASCFDKIITSKTLKPSAQRQKYMALLLAEWYIGQPIEDNGSAFMERGTQLEQEAADWYAFANDQEVVTVGHCIRDDDVAGASPDRLVGKEGILEIKCPALHTHTEYLLFGLDDYRMQAQGELWVTGRKWVDLISYSPVMPAKVVRIEPDPDVFAAFDRELPRFAAEVAVHKATLTAARAHCASVAEVASDHVF